MGFTIVHMRLIGVIQHGRGEGGGGEELARRARGREALFNFRFMNVYLGFSFVLDVAARQMHDFGHNTIIVVPFIDAPCSSSQCVLDEIC